MVVNAIKKCFLGGARRLRLPWREPPIRPNLRGFGPNFVPKICLEAGESWRLLCPESCIKILCVKRFKYTVVL